MLHVLLLWRQYSQLIEYIKHTITLYIKSVVGFFFFTLKAFLYIQTLYCFDFRETRTGLFFYINFNYYKNVIFFCNFEEQKSCIEEKTDGKLWKTTFAGRNEEIPCPENQKGRDIVIKIN